MNGLIHLLPVGFAMACWYLAYRVNRVHRWFRVVLLIVVFLFWLNWF